MIGRVRRWSILAALAALAVVALTLAGCANVDGAEEPTVVGTAEIAAPTATLTALPPHAEAFVPVEIPMGNQVVAVTGYRTAAETVVDVTVPPGTVLSRDPKLMVGGWAAPVGGGGQEAAGGTPVVATGSAQQTETGIEMHFGPTPAGSTLNLDLGTFVADPDVPSVSVTVDVAKVLARAKGGAKAHGTFPIEPGDVIAGEARIAMSVERFEAHGTLEPPEGVGITVSGIWLDSHEQRPHLFDQDGHDLLHISAGASHRDRILPDKTTVSIAVWDPSDIKTLRLELGPALPSPVAQTVELKPQ
jgi:hypothetical protein